MSLSSYSMTEEKQCPPWHCNVCGRQCSSYLLLQQHLLLQHEGRQPYQCSYCGQQFPLRPYLVSHLSAEHGGPRGAALTCTICGRGFTVWLALRAHIQAVHMGKTPYACELCGEEFVMRPFLVSHMRAHTEEHLRAQEEQRDNDHSEEL